MSGISFEPLLHPALWIALAALSAAVLLWYGWQRPIAFPRRRWGLAMALAALGQALVLVILLNPIWLEAIPPPAGKPLVTILADRSASMATTEGEASQTRLARAIEQASALSQSLSRDFDVQVRTFDAATVAVSTEQLAGVTADGQSTDLAAAILASLAADRPQGQALLLLSDGIHNAPGGSARVLQSVHTAKAMAVPIYTATIGGAAQLRDLELALAREQELALAGQKVPLRATVRQRGALASSAEVVLLKAGQEIARQTVQVPPNGTANVTLDVLEPAAGLSRYELRIDKHPAEATTANNSATFILRTIDRPIRVLLLEGKPYWDAKFLIRTLSQDASLELDAVVRVADGRFVKRKLHLAAASGTEPGGPLTPAPQRQQESEMVKDLSQLLAAESLGTYQVVVLGRDAEAYLDGDVLESLRNWISQDGGALVCFRGAPVAQMSQQLSRLMPVRWNPGSETRFRVQLTGRGQDLRWISAADPQGDVLAHLPSLSTAARPQRPSALAVILAQDEGKEQPVMTYQPYGTGRVVAIEGAGMWRWAFLAPQHQRSEPIYDELWRGLMRWLALGGGLAPGQNATLRTDRVSFFTGEAASATLLVREEVAVKGIGQVELRHTEGGTRVQFTPAPVGEEPGVFRVDFGILPEGQYLATLPSEEENAELTVAFDVRPNYSEQLDVASRPDLMARIAAESGGAVLEEAGGTDLARKFFEHLSSSRPARFREIPLWDRWWVLTSIVGLWGVAWGMRRAGGLV
ncbi:MAG TPA: hypothetical protein VMP01_16770 [Pirellulaceae bacterium]|nr:hypothetical protein [Pirellulaceae bacterium]